MYALNGYRESKVVPESPLLTLGAPLAVGVGGGGRGGHRADASRISGASSLEIDIPYTRQCEDGGLFAVCADGETHLIIAHGIDDNWIKGHAPNGKHSLTTLIHPRERDVKVRNTRGGGVGGGGGGGGGSLLPLLND